MFTVHILGLAYLEFIVDTQLIHASLWNISLFWSTHLLLLLIFLGLCSGLLERLKRLLLSHLLRKA